ncbi:LysE family translocator [Geodermatophilus obscurus]|uniref:Lysine exporter protein (LYSE/YGGA) n=1 Tax=Geodermatophilus obscurus (strain ATCC 25078 / DSM 43160 / JCM 3152 / CCUG 61914 / KCC A-0152 / KCTC 9177 / NBRC 13315 / NRRL B-3577 / G-20) TaxID=526225 RepID=D2SG01_GEOOG|nr:LysE family translocator [Geodermatophilus obscurus]ADB74906.1 Lysine exporter protein (LYSE/YGGA) [Geodermatophilus obscurus DSM 43160]
MTWATYGSFLVFTVALVLVPGPDVAVTTRNTLAGGRTRGAWTAVGITSSNAVQGLAAAAGLGALVVRSQPLFEVIRWAGVGYLAYLGVQALRSAVADRYPADELTAGTGTAQRLAGWRQGFLSNITNPKVLVFYLAVLPQFLTPDSGVPTLVLLALTHAVLGLLYLLLLVAGMHRARAVLGRRRVRRALDAVTGTVLLGFGVRLATERG